MSDEEASRFYASEVGLRQEDLEIRTNILRAEIRDLLPEYRRIVLEALNLGGEFGRGIYSLRPDPRKNDPAIQRMYRSIANLL